uniref:Uncharacterized protein n=1 Tax=Solanum tuberosum TaxID=4113 RepID=M1D9G5_SOLTU
MFDFDVKGGKDGNPLDLATIFFEKRKKDNKLVKPEAIEKHAQLKEMVQADPSLPSIEIVEKYCGPQTRSHVFGFRGEVKEKDMKASNYAFVTPQTRGEQLAPNAKTKARFDPAPNAKTQARFDPAEPFATSAWQPHAIKKSNKYIST